MVSQSFGLTIDEYRQLLIRHILLGDCMRGSENKDCTGCRQIIEGFKRQAHAKVAGFAVHRHYIYSANTANPQTGGSLKFLYEGADGC
jgi:hypothetical protein